MYYWMIMFYIWSIDGAGAEEEDDDDSIFHYDDDEDEEAALAELEELLERSW